MATARTAAETVQFPAEFGPCQRGKQPRRRLGHRFVGQDQGHAKWVTDLEVSGQYEQIAGGHLRWPTVELQQTPERQLVNLLHHQHSRCGFSRTGQPQRTWFTTARQ